ncbi:2-amino-4-hydroxy-6-hydroxymethyldihydropteridine diphosphokinase [Candidatus Acetothermia bacterium]|nr:2-amino-4-hydroxy-6-hydroxymethyldihydropteridine diphosphokinase [Candidatus Acetothermia bacterium]
METERVFLSLGANIGDRAANIHRAEVNLAENKIKIVARSAMYETEPVEQEDQPWFLNMVIRVKTDLSPLALLSRCKEIEFRLGRKPGPRFGPRQIDIDILLFDNAIINTDDLIIPHPRLTERRFMLLPLLEIEPQLIDPRDNVAFSDKLRRLNKQKKVQKLTKELLPY